MGEHSRAFLNSIYAQYYKRLCEKLGVPYGDENADSDNVDLSADEYPQEFKKFSQDEIEQNIAEDGITDEEFLAQFDKIKG